MKKNNTEPKILTLDIETSPMLLYSYELWQDNHSVGDIKEDWRLMSFACKWLHRKEVIQHDLSSHSEKQLLVLLSRAINSADIIVTQNGKKFDMKKISAKLVEYKLKPVKRCQQFDTLVESKKLYKFPSHSLEYMSGKLNKKYKKLKHEKFPGQELWKECMKGNPKAWAEMAKYNKYDVLATEELFLIIRPYSNVINWTVFTDLGECFCGGQWRKNGWCYTSTGRYQRYDCRSCGAELRGQQITNKVKLRKVS